MSELELNAGAEWHGKNYATREDRKTGQFIPVVNGRDMSPTSFDEGRALEIARQIAESAKATGKDGAAMK